MVTNQPSAGYNFNNFMEIKSHSSILFNERMAILFYQLDQFGIRINRNPEIEDILEFKGILSQIYSNTRMLIQNNPIVRAHMRLDTNEEGIYITDVGFGIIEKMIEYCQNDSYTPKRLHIIKMELVHVERIIKNVLQYYHYFIRPDFRQKPDLDIATTKYKEIADERTVEELRELVGKNNKIDFESLGTARINLEKPQSQIDYENEDNEGSMSESDGTYDSKEWD